jgi:hypothetical protein
LELAGLVVQEKLGEDAELPAEETVQGGLNSAVLYNLGSSDEALLLLFQIG